MIRFDYDIKMYQDLFLKALDIFHPFDRSFHILSEMAKFSICGMFDSVILIQMASLSKKKLEILLKIYQNSVKKSRKLRPPFHYQTGIHELEVAIICAFLGKIDMANEAFKRYTDIERVFNAPEDNLPIIFYEELRFRRIKLEEAKRKKDYPIAYLKKIVEPIRGL